MLSDYFDAYATRHRPYKGGSWCYEDGCIYRGLALLHEATGERRWLDHVVRLVDRQTDGATTLPGYEITEFNIDHILAGRTLWWLYATTGDRRYRLLCEPLLTQLANHPRTRSGVYWHKLRYPWQVWLDGLYMGLPFQIEAGQVLGRDALVSDALAQLATALDLAFVEETGLYAHAVDEARLQPWADPETGRSAAHWARALGWLSMALVDIADLVGPVRFAPFTARTEALFARLVGLRTPSGLWLQVVDRLDLAGNYDEMSASAMFTYALQKARRLGLSVPPFGNVAAKLEARAMRPGTGGRLEMAEICEVAGLGWYNDRFRDGSAQYYLTEARVADDAKGVGPLMMGIAESLRTAPQSAQKVA